MWRRGSAVVVHDHFPHSITMPTARPAMLLRDLGMEVHVVDIGAASRQVDEGVTKWRCASRAAVARRVAALRPELLFLEGSTWHLLLLPLARRTWVRATGRSPRPALAAAQRAAIHGASVVSVSNPDHATRWQLPTDRLLDLPYPVDVDFWSTPVARDEDLWLRHGAPVPVGPVVSYAAQLMRRKRQAEMVHGLGPLLRKRGDVVVAFAGAPVERGAHDVIVAAAAAEGVLDQVRLLGALSREELRTLYAWSTVHCVNSEWETQCMVVYESLAAGVPNAVSAIPVLTSAFPSLPAHHDNDELRTNVTRLLDDAASRSRVIDASRQRLAWADVARHDELFISTVKRLLV